MCFALLLLLALPAAADVAPAEPPADAEVAAARLSPRHERFLRDVEPLISELEREVFLSLEDYQREQFIRRFWEVRDPFPQTGRNELREAWEARLVAARERWDDLTQDRPRLFLALGEPQRKVHIYCRDVLRPLELWFYPRGAGRVRGGFALTFVGQQPNGRGPHRLWRRSEGLRSLVALGAVGLGFEDRRIAQAVEESCQRGSELFTALAQALDLGDAGDDPAARLLPPPPSEEWVRTLRARSTAVPAGAEPLHASTSWSFPGRHQSRTVVQGLVTVPAGAAEPVERGDYRGHAFVLDGEVLREGELFEQFRYRFDFPHRAGDADADLPLVIQRYLRPGKYDLVVKVQDLASDRVYREEHRVEVPRVERRRRPVAVSADGSVTAVAAETETDVRAGDGAVDADRGGDVAPRLLGRRLAEANASIATGDHSIRLRPPPDDTVAVGKIRVHAQARGEGIARVAFELDGRPMLAKSRPPYSVEIDLGDKPRLHDLRAVALDHEGRTLASDELVLNAGPHRFGVRLIEPQPGRRYRDSLRVHAEVEVPERERLDRVELYLNDALLATLYQRPFEQPVLLDGGDELSWVRAVAYLADGARAEDTVFINAPDFIDQLDVSVVELYTTVVDRKKNFAEGLTVDDFRVFEDGEEQTITRFELVRDLPIYAGIVLDTSQSMAEELREVEKAAYRFLETVLRPRDRAAVMTFNDAPTLRVRLTGDKAVLAGGLAELEAEGETALYDTIIFALHYFSGLRGKRAVVLLTDGVDYRSRYSYSDALEFAQHTGVALYVIALGLPTRSSEVTLLLRRLAHETGGELFTIQSATQLGRIYDAIQEELRSQYLLAYQSTNSTGQGFRRVEVKVEGKGLEAKTISGYFP